MKHGSSNNCFSLCNFAVVVTFLLVVLTSQQGQGCQCPSCHYSSATQNCQCCVFRQLGKRADPNLALTPETAAMTSDLQSGLPHYPPQRTIHEDDAYRRSFSQEAKERALFSDWLLSAMRERHPSFYYYDVNAGTDDVMKPRMRAGEGLSGYYFSKAANPKLSPLQSRVLESMDLGDSDSQGVYTYN